MSDKKPKSELDAVNDGPIIPDKSDPPKADHKNLGGGDRDAWNHLMMFSVLDAQPRSHNGSEKEKHDQARAVWAGMADINPADPIEGIIIAQLMAANQASLTMYQRAWAQPNEYFEARTRYLALADKAARTVVLLTERLDHHRGRGQQKIIVQHVTTNNVTADQAVITDSLVTNGGASNVLSPALLTANAGTPMPALDETKQPRLVGVGWVGKKNEQQPHAKRPRRSAMQRQMQAHRAAVSLSRGARFPCLPDARRPRWCAEGQAERKLSTRSQDEGGGRRRSAHQRAGAYGA